MLEITAKKVLPGEPSLLGLWLAASKTMDLHTHGIQTLKRGEYLFRVGTPSCGFFIIESGCFKVYCVDPAGREYINAFRFQGSMVGLHSFAPSTYILNAVALMPSTACKVNFKSFTAAIAHKPELHTAFLSTLSRELASHYYLSSNLTAVERVASFLLAHISILQSADGNPNLYFPMSRSDIATHLRLALATVSRILSKFRENRLIEADYHHIHILDEAAIRQLCENVPFMSGSHSKSFA